MKCACPAQVLLPHRKDVKLESVLACHNYLVVFHRTNGLQVHSFRFYKMSCACRVSATHLTAHNVLLRFLSWLAVPVGNSGLPAGQGATVYPLSAGAPTELGSGKDIAFEEAAYELGPGGQGDYESDLLRLGYSSLSTPYSTIDYNMSTGARSAHTCHAPSTSRS